MKPLLKNWLFRNRNRQNNLFKTALPNFRKSCFSLFFLVIPFCSFSQNLVPNNSFELYDTCPNSVGQISYASPWFGETVDYYNSCASTVCPYCGLPSAAGGYQYARTGSAISGIFGYYYNLSSSQREYLQTTLFDTLVNGYCYLTTFYINLFNGSRWGIKNMAANFSDTTFINPSFGVVPLQANVFKFGKPLISDTMNWVKIQGVYSASGGEIYFTIGNFVSDANIDTVLVNPSGWSAGSYYFIDDVSVIPIDSIPGGMPANAGNDATILSGDSVFIGQEITNLNCNWYIGATLIADSVSGLYVSPEVTTTYTVKQNLCGTITYDTVTVFVSGVGINENKLAEEINLFPNPNAGNFSLLYKKDIHIEIIDITGSLIYSNNLFFLSGNSTLKLDISNGVYFVHITNIKTHEAIVKKLVIQK